MELKLLLPALREIVVSANQQVMEIYNDELLWGIEKKTDNSPLTKADLASNAVICAGLEQLQPRFPIISEENDNISYETRKDFEYFWLVDPLDGTREFIKRNGEFTVNIALVNKDKPILGIVGVPTKDEIYWAIESQGAFVERNGTTKELKSSSFGFKDKQLKVVCSRSHLSKETEAFLTQLDEPEMLPLGSSLKFLAIAEGRAHLYPKIGPTMEWDSGAAQIILEEAGGSVLHLETRKRLVYNKENLLNPNFIAHAKLNSPIH